MREILFRAKRKDNSEWIEGSLLKFRENTYIIPHDSDYCYDDIEKFAFDVEYFEVILETVGQYTGLTDKNGVKIFEGDIVKKTEGTPSVKKVEFHDNEAAFITTWKFHEHELYDLLRAYTMPGRNDVEFFEVIGNIYDNPELLEGESE